MVVIIFVILLMYIWGAVLYKKAANFIEENAAHLSEEAMLYILREAGFKFTAVDQKPKFLDIILAPIKTLWL